VPLQEFPRSTNKRRFVLVPEHLGLITISRPVHSLKEICSEVVIDAHLQLTIELISLIVSRKILRGLPYEMLSAR
jgi:hypothetical protein